MKISISGTLRHSNFDYPAFMCAHDISVIVHLVIVALVGHLNIHLCMLASHLLLSDAIRGSNTAYIFKQSKIFIS